MTKYYGHDKPCVCRYKVKRITRVAVANPGDIYLIKERLIKTKPWEKLSTILKATEALEKNLSMADSAFTGFVNNKVICLFGAHITNFIEKRVQLWLLVTEDIHNIDISFLRGSRYFLDWFRSVYKILEVKVDAEFESSVKWLKWLGFQVISSEFIDETEILSLEMRV